MESKSSNSSLSKRPELDGIRGLAVLAVISWHIGIPFVKAGNIGVDIFFVLSGFLITSLLWFEWTHTGSINLKHFFIRRGLRLFPALAAVLGVYSVYTFLFETGNNAQASYLYILATLGYFANWAQIIWGLHHSTLGHTWSLAVEEQFYLLYPVLLLVGLRLALPARYLFTISLTAIFLVLFERSMLWTGIESYDRVVMGLDTRADALLAGCSVAFALAGNLLPRGFFAIWFFRFLALGSAVFVSYLVIMGVKNEPYYNDGLASLTAICVGLVIFEMAGPNPMKTTRRILGVRPLAWTGRISYGLYLWHIPVFYFLGTPSNWSGAQIQTARFLTVFAVAALSYYSIELPFLKLKQRFSISRLVHETRSNDQIHEGVLITTSPAAL